MTTHDDMCKTTHDFALIGQGPWLRDVSGLRFARQVMLWSTLASVTALALGWGLLACLAAIGMIGGWASMGIEMATRRDWQYCPQCLKSMASGAIVCPWCGKREEERYAERP